MKNLILDYLELTNFRGVKHHKLSFDSTVSTIVGPNGSGKSSFSEAWYNLWTGFDMRRQSNFEIKPRDKYGKTIPRVSVVIEAGIQFNGTPIVLRKEIHEKWGPISDDNPEEEFKETFFKYAVDGVYLERKKDWQAALDNIIKSSDIEVMANPDYFLEMDQAAMRKQIVDLVGGEISDEELATTKPEYKKIVEALKLKSIDDYKKQIANAITAAEKSKKDTPILIEENIHKIAKLPTEAEFAETERLLLDKNKELEAIDLKLSQTESEKENESDQKLQTDLQNAKNELNRFSSDFDTKQQIEKQKIENLKLPIEVEKNRLDIKIKDLKSSISENSSKVETLISEKNALLAKYELVKQRVFTEPDIDGDELPKCDACGQTIPLEDLISGREKRLSDFKNKVAEDKKAINEEGKEKSGKIKAIQVIIDADKEILASSTTKFTELETELSSDKYIFKAKVITEDDQYVSIKNKIENIQAEIKSDKVKSESDEGGEVSEKDTLIESKKTIMSSIAFLNQTLGKKTELAEHNNRIAQLKDELDKTNKALMGWKKADSVMKSFLSDRSSILQEKVNKRFKRIKFEMFEYTLEGNEKLVCIPTMDGVKYKTTNTANKTIAQVDVANTWTEKTGILPVLFLDNQESNGLSVEYPGQIINIIYFRPEEGEPEKYSHLQVI